MSDDLRASVDALIAEHEAKVAARDDRIAELERRLAQIGELAHVEAEQPEQPTEGE